MRTGDELVWTSPARMVERTLERIDAAGRDYVWFSGEASDMREVRTRLRRTLRRPTEQWMTMGYWRRDEECWLARFRGHPELAAQMEALYAAGGDGEELRDRAEALLRRHGL